MAAASGCRPRSISNDATSATIDLAAAVGFDRDALLRNVEQVRPGLEVIEASARTGEGFERWMALLERRSTVQAGAST